VDFYWGDHLDGAGGPLHVKELLDRKCQAETTFLKFDTQGDV
jgi:hypothetical protein